MVQELVNPCLIRLDPTQIDSRQLDSMIKHPVTYLALYPSAPRQPLLITVSSFPSSLRCSRWGRRRETSQGCYCWLTMKVDSFRVWRRGRRAHHFSILSGLLAGRETGLNRAGRRRTMTLPHLKSNHLMYPLEPRPATDLPDLLDITSIKASIKEM